MHHHQASAGGSLRLKLEHLQMEGHIQQTSQQRERQIRIQLMVQPKNPLVLWQYFYFDDYFILEVLL